MLPMPQGDSKEQLLLMQQAVDRLSSIGYTDIAFCYTIYGKAKQVDAAATSLSLVSKLNPKSLQILKRLHVVVENLSDVGYYTMENNSIKSILQTYDLVSMSPRNESAFVAACSTATLIDIVTLDYTSGRGGVQLPYKIRTMDVKNICKRGVAIEIPYSHAILTLGQRKALVATAQALQSNSLGTKPKVLLSSGDSNPMALRAPGDLINLMTTVLQFNPTISYAALNEVGGFVVEKAKRRHFGTIANIYFEQESPEQLNHTNDDLDKTLPLDKSSENKDKVRIGIVNATLQGDSNIEDGFITL